VPKRIFYILIISRLVIFFLPGIIGPFFGFYNFSWNRWDAPHYLYISEFGYTNVGDEANFIVFYPLYPLVVKALGGVIGSYRASGLILSNVFFFVGSLGLYKLIREIYSEETAELTLITLILFPTSYFFSVPYAESLFLFLFSLAVYFVYKKRYAFSGVFAGMATLTRPFGILIVPLIFVEWFAVKEKQKGLGKRVIELLYLVFPSLFALLVYFYINQKVFGDMFAFKEVLQNNWYKSLSYPWTGLLNSWKLAFSGIDKRTIMVGWIEAVSVTVSWILIPVAYKNCLLPFECGDILLDQLYIEYAKIFFICFSVSCSSGLFL